MIMMINRFLQQPLPQLRTELESLTKKCDDDFTALEVPFSVIATFDDGYSSNNIRLHHGLL
jgi:hypothetical protein